MEILYTQLPDREEIFEYLVRNRGSYTHLSVCERDYEIIRTLPGFFVSGREGEDGRFAGLIIIVE